MFSNECYVVGDSAPTVPYYSIWPQIPNLNQCGRSSAVYNNFFKKQQSFIPVNGDTAPASVVKNIKVRFVIVEKNNTGSVKTNFRMSDTQDLHKMVTWVNQFFSGSIPETQPNNPVTSICGGNCYIKDRRIRVDLTGIDFVNDLTSYSFNSNSGSLRNDGKYKDSIINIYFFVDTNRRHVDSATSIVFWTGGGMTDVDMDALVGPDYDTIISIYICNTYLTANTTPLVQPVTYSSMLWEESTRLFHELNHALGLGHLQVDQNSTPFNGEIIGQDPAGCSGSDYLADAYPGSCPMSIYDDSTNNVMNMGLPGGFGIYLSPLQTDRINRNAFIGNVSKYMYPTEPPEEHPWIVDSSQTWDFPIRMFQDIVVTSGHTLTIKCEVQMPHDSRILVQKNAKLIIDGGLVTSYAPTYNWAGIELEGDTAEPPLPQYQGSLVMKNNAEMDYAWHGIRNFTWDNGAQGGGIIDVENSTIRNCWRSVELNDYPKSYFTSPTVSQCKFDNVNFLIDDTLAFRFHTVPQNLFTSYNTLGGIQISNCRFANTIDRNVIMPQQDRGGAIYTLASGMSVTNTAFESFKKGIYAAGYAGFPDRTVKIYSDTFNYITENITLAASPFGDIRGNYITNMLPYPGSNEMVQGRGIYLDRTNNTVVKCNNYIDGMTDGHLTYDNRGVVVNQSYPYNATVINNTFENLFAGTETQMDNTGLNIVCNGYANNSYALLVNPQTTATIYHLKDQGTGCAINNIRAGNTFANNWTDIASYLQNNWNYWWWNSTSTANQDPVNVIGSSINSHGCTNTGSDPNSQCNSFATQVACMTISSPSDLNQAIDTLYRLRSMELGATPMAHAVYNNIVQGYNNLNDRAGLMSFLEGEQTDDARRALIPLYLETGSYATMDSAIRQLSVVTVEKNAYTTYYGILSGLQQSHRGLSQLTAAEFNTVQSIADSNYEVSGYAKALLEGEYQTAWNHPVEEPALTGNRPANSIARMAMDTAKSRLYPAVPNPTGDKTSISVYLTKRDAGNVRLVIRNMTGEQLYVNKQLRAGKNNVAIFTRNWAAGIYFCSLEINGAVIATEKLSVTH